MTVSNPDFSKLVVGLAVYLAPAAVAGNPGHRNAVAIFVLNLSLGWTVIGWLVALIWACTANTTQPSS
jgi:hypothetical protein